MKVTLQWQWLAVESCWVRVNPPVHSTRAWCVAGGARPCTRHLVRGASQVVRARALDTWCVVRHGWCAPVHSTPGARHTRDTSPGVGCVRSQEGACTASDQ